MRYLLFMKLILIIFSVVHGKYKHLALFQSSHINNHPPRSNLNCIHLGQYYSHHHILHSLQHIFHPRKHSNIHRLRRTILFRSWGILHLRILNILLGFTIDNSHNSIAHRRIVLEKWQSHPHILVCINRYL